MEILTYTSFRTQIKAVMDKVNDDQKPVLITRKKGKPVVVMSLQDFNSYNETAYLMASPQNALRINESIEEIDAAKPVHGDIDQNK